MGKYVVRKGSNGQYFWNLRTDNGEHILTSEMYTTKGAAFGGISACKENSAIDERYAHKTAPYGPPYFTLSARNGEIIGRSEDYYLYSREYGINLCKLHGPISGTVDETGEK